MAGSVIVIGGGPAGMMASIAAAERGLKVLLLEGNEKLGKKLYITGKGRCNLTNDCTTEEFLSNVPRGAAFLRSSLSGLDSRGLMAFFEESGVPLIVERGNRVFPASQKASDITRALQRRMERAGVKTRTGVKVLGLEGAQGVRLEGETLSCDAVIVATGGITYPATGSTGDGYRFAAEAGHDALPPRPSLVPLETVAHWPTQLQGLTLKNVALRGKLGKKTLFDQMGEMLFTHFGISGPLALSLSAHLPEDPADMEVSLDLKPALPQEQVDARVLREMEAAGRKQIATVLYTLMPQSMAPVFLRELGIDPTVPAHQITKAQRSAIAVALKHLPLAIRATRPPEEAVITRGGVSLKQVNPKTMASKLVPNLHFAGEVLDIDAYTGGFNLQIAFCTGYAAGKHVLT